MRSLARWGALPLVITPLGSWALGLGEIEPGSYLNQPLYAEIPLSATPEELAGLSVSMASSAEFARRGIERPGFLSTLTFDVVRNSFGENVIRVTSTRSITEPFVTLVVEARLPGRTQFREYTVLLDPPLFLPDASAVEPVAPPVAREPAASGAGAIDRPATSALPEAEPVPEFEPETVPTPQQAQAPAIAAGGDYTVQGGDTLWAIATRSRPSGITMNQTMMSIYQANPEAFVGNINRLRRGAILRIPPASELGRMSAADATAEVARQTQAWASGAEPSPELVLLPPSDEPIDAVAAGAAEADAAAQADSAQAEAEATPAETAGLQDEFGNLAQDSAEQERLLELQSGELANLQNQLDQTESPLVDDGAPESELQIEAVEAGPEAEAETDAGAEAALAAAASELDAVAPDQVFVDESEPVEEAATEAAATPAAAQPEEPSFLGSIFGFLTQPLFLIALGVLAVLAAAFAFLRRRQDSLEDVTGQWEALESEVDEEIGSTTLRGRTEPGMTAVDSPELASAAAAAVAAGSDDEFGFEQGTVEISAPTNVDVEPEDFEDDFDAEPESAADADPDPVRDAAFAEQTLSNQTVINLDQADPIAEADFHMAYGLYDQAADLVTKALDSDPDNHELKLKLLEVYFVWGNKEQFLAQAQALHGEIGAEGGADWDKVVIMGKQICPDETLFAGSMSAAPEIDLELTSGESDAAGLDFTLEDSEDDVDFGLATIDDAEIELEKELESEPNQGALDRDAAASEAGLGETRVEDEEAFDLDDSDLDEPAADVVATGKATSPAADQDDDSLLDIGEQTQAGLEAAFLDLDDDDAEALSGAHAETAFDVGSDAQMMAEALDAEELADNARWADDSVAAEPEGAPAVEAGEDESDVAATLEAPELDDDIDEFEDLEAVSFAAGGSSGGDTVEHVRPSATSQTEMTTELELDDLGLDTSDISDLPHDLGESGTDHLADNTLEQPGPGIGDDDDLLSATGVTEVLRDDMDLDPTGTVAFEEGEASDDDSFGIRTEVLEQPVSRHDPDASAGEDDLDLNLDDFSSALDGGATAEQPGLSGYGVDLDVGADVPGDDEPTGTEDIGQLDPQTMTEVGTKLDLARAYIDMGDPEGAKSILEEVMTEGDSGQRSEAQALINALPA